MIDERVEDAMQAHRKKVLWQLEQEGDMPVGNTVIPAYRSHKDVNAFVPPNGMMKK